MAGVTIGAVDGFGITALSVNVGTASAVNVVTAVTGQRARIYKMWVSAAAATTLTIQDGATAVTGPITMSTGTPVVLPMDGQPWISGSVGNALNFNLSSAVNVAGIAWITQG